MTKTKSIFITGGTSGIGLELAKFYLKKGLRVGVSGRDLSKIDHALSEPSGISVKGNTLWVANRNNHEVLSIDLNTQQVTFPPAAYKTTWLSTYGNNPFI